MRRGLELDFDFIFFVPSVSSTLFSFFNFLYTYPLINRDHLRFASVPKTNKTNTWIWFLGISYYTIFGTDKSVNWSRQRRQTLAFAFICLLLILTFAFIISGSSRAQNQSSSFLTMTISIYEDIVGHVYTHTLGCNEEHILICIYPKYVFNKY